MAILTRLKQMVKADAHAVLDNIEEPKALLKQSIREMESLIHEAETEVKQLALEQETTANSLKSLINQSDEIKNELELCLSENQDELARHVVKQKLNNEHLIKSNRALISSLKETIAGKQNTLEQNKSKLTTLRHKASTQDKPHSTLNDDNISTLLQISDEDIELELLKEKNKRGNS